MKGICFALIALLAACSEPVRLAERGRAHVAEDSDRVRAIVFAERNLQMRERGLRMDIRTREMTRAELFQGKEAPRRRDFLNNLDSSPGFFIDTATDARLLETLKDCGCTLKETFTTAIARIRITSGPFAGRVGWICEDKIRRLWIWP